MPEQLISTGGAALMIAVDDSTAGMAVVTLTGALSLAAAPRVRDTLMKCVAEQPSAIVVDLSLARVEQAYVLNVFSMVARRAELWSGVQLILVSGAALEGGHSRAARALGQFVRICPTLPQARAAARRAPLRRLAVMILPPSEVSPRTARTYVTDVCTTWGCTTLLEDAVLVANELVCTALHRSVGDLVLRLELRRGLLTVAVTDDCPDPPDLTEYPGGPPVDPISLRLLTELAKACGSSPTRNGDRINWAVLRDPTLHPEDPTLGSLHRPQLPPTTHHTGRSRLIPWQNHP
ncbi:STAS domain-containing protein [Kribbella sp. DT2]|uniref:STAS domain-containing protein n=1 Tax=Kribbella sp. DT2 TaxID=3393427 RepID=UPI003CF4B4DE